LAGALPQTPLAELTAPPGPLAGFMGPTSKGMGGEGRGGRKGRGGKGVDGRGGGARPVCLLILTILATSL